MEWGESCLIDVPGLISIAKDTDVSKKALLRRKHLGFNWPIGKDEIHWQVGRDILAVFAPSAYVDYLRPKPQAMVMMLSIMSSHRQPGIPRAPSRLEIMAPAMIPPSAGDTQPEV